MRLYFLFDIIIPILGHTNPKLYLLLNAIVFDLCEITEKKQLNVELLVFLDLRNLKEY